MKKQIIVATGLAVLSTSAWATKSRMVALGQDAERGSLYIQDTRNIFRNAAHVNSFKNYVVTEWGTANAGAADSGTAPHAEGGFFREMGAFSYGVYLGNNNDAEEGVRNGSGYTGAGTVTTGAGALADQDNAIDLFFGGDMGIQWGASLRYAKNKYEDSTAATANKEHSAMGLSLGIIMGDLDAYASMKLKDESKGDGTTADAKYEAGGMQVGVGYNLGDLRVFADYEKKDAEYVSAAGVAKNTTEVTYIRAGAAKTHEVSSSARVIYSATYTKGDAEDKDGTTVANNREGAESYLDLGIAMEADANSWLTLRGSVMGPAIINSTEVKSSTQTVKNFDDNRVSVAAGATLNFGKLKVDGSIGTTDGARNAASIGTKGGVLTLDNAMSRVAVHYWF